MKNLLNIIFFTLIFGAIGLNKRGCLLLSVVCRSDSSCLNDDVFLNKCYERYNLNDEEDAFGTTIIKDWGRTTSPYISKQLDPSPVDYPNRYNDLNEDIRTIQNRHIRESFQHILDKISNQKQEELQKLFQAYQEESLRESLYFLKRRLVEDQRARIQPAKSSLTHIESDAYDGKVAFTPKLSEKQKKNLSKYNNKTETLLNTLIGELEKKFSKIERHEKQIKDSEDKHDKKIVPKKSIKYTVAKSVDDLRAKIYSKKIRTLPSNKKTNYSKKKLVNSDIISEFKRTIKPIDREIVAIPEVIDNDTTSDLEKRGEKEPEYEGYLIIKSKERLNQEKATKLGEKLQEYLWNITSKEHKIFHLTIVENNTSEYLMTTDPTWFQSVDDVKSVAAKINSDSNLRKKLKGAIGVDVDEADYIQLLALPTAHQISSDDKDWNHLTIFTAILGGCTFTIVVIALIVYTLKRKSFNSPIGFKKQEAVQDYQELCRTQMSVVHNSGENESEKENTMKSSWTENSYPYNMDITTGHVILSFMEDHLQNEQRLNKEWEELCSYKADDVTTNCGADTKNNSKNRYVDVLPFDHTRVKLREVSNMFHSDYINANFITDINPRQPEYIATQGPLANTGSDFWQMVWEQGIVVIVNLTKLSDTGLPQCHRYWPDNGKEVYHIYEVHLISEHIWCDDYLVRSLYLKNLQTGETRTVTQFHYLAWPDLSVPQNAKPLLEFRRKVNKCYRGQACPIIVHCNNGIGRTGTYILLDMVLNKLVKGAKEIDIAATLEHIRDQRPDMVKTKGQFEFALLAVAEEVTSILSPVNKY